MVDTLPGRPPLLAFSAMPDDLDARMASAGREYVEARGSSDAARETVHQLALEADAAGYSERRIAARLGVDRMTVRKWLGKG